jgi:hypothetical protein
MTKDRKDKNRPLYIFWWFVMATYIGWLIAAMIHEYLTG